MLLVVNIKENSPTVEEALANFEIELENASDEVVSLMMDGREAYVLSPFERVSVRASERELKMISFSGSRMLSTLIEKMKKIEMI